MNEKPYWIQFYVSIHASVKDATLITDKSNSLFRVSIHASVKDATSSDGWTYPEGEVSIHASVKDATVPIR